MSWATDKIKALLGGGREAGEVDALAVNADDGNKTLLHYASDPSEAYAILQHSGPDILTMTDSDGNTALHAAAARGKYRLCLFLLHLGINPKQKNKAGFQALQLSLSLGLVRDPMTRESKLAVASLLRHWKTRLAEHKTSVILERCEGKAVPHSIASVVVAGEKGSGKTSLLLAFAGCKFDKAQKGTYGAHVPAMEVSVRKASDGSSASAWILEPGATSHAPEVIRLLRDPQIVDDLFDVFNTDQAALEKKAVMKEREKGAQRSSATVVTKQQLQQRTGTAFGTMQDTMLRAKEMAAGVKRATLSTGVASSTSSTSSPTSGPLTASSLQLYSSVMRAIESTGRDQEGEQPSALETLEDVASKDAASPLHLRLVDLSGAGFGTASTLPFLSSSHSLYLVTFSLLGATHKDAKKRAAAWTALEHWIQTIYLSFRAKMASTCTGDDEPRVIPLPTIFLVGTFSDKVKKQAQHSAVSEQLLNRFGGKPWFSCICVNTPAGVRHGVAASELADKIKKGKQGTLLFWPVANSQRVKPKDSIFPFATKDHKQLQRAIVTLATAEGRIAQREVSLGHRAFFDAMYSESTRSEASPLIWTREQLLKEGKKFGVLELDEFLAHFGQVGMLYSFLLPKSLLASDDERGNTADSIGVVFDLQRLATTLTRFIRVPAVMESAADRHAPKSALHAFRTTGVVDKRMLNSLLDTAGDDEEQKRLLAAVLIEWGVLIPQSTKACPRDIDFVPEKLAPGLKKSSRKSSNQSSNRGSTTDMARQVDGDDDVDVDGEGGTNADSTDAPCHYSVVAAAPMTTASPPKKVASSLDTFQLPSVLAHALSVGGTLEHGMPAFRSGLGAECLEVYALFFTGPSPGRSVDGADVLSRVQLAEDIAQTSLVLPELLFEHITAHAIWLLYRNYSQAQTPPGVSRTQATVHFLSDDIDKDREVTLSIVHTHEGIRGVKLTVQADELGKDGKRFLSFFSLVLQRALATMCGATVQPHPVRHFPPPPSSTSSSSSSTSSSQPLPMLPKDLPVTFRLYFPTPSGGDASLVQLARVGAVKRSLESKAALPLVDAAVATRGSKRAAGKALPKALVPDELEQLYGAWF